nr:DEAD/DEAH box helicase [Microbacterium sp. NIBRBAC000506063]
MVAPTGSGKTLSAFLWAIDRVFRERSADPERKGSDAAGTRILYISPLKALGVDVERNLRSPSSASVRPPGAWASTPQGVGGRTFGRHDLQRAPQARLLPARHPHHHPESLYLMLTSRAGETLRGVHTVIVDEVHAVAATKRGAHLAVSLERLDALRQAHDAEAGAAQRIGLSATVRPIDEVARFLGGAAPVEIVAPKASKTFDLRVTVPIEDMRNPPPPPNPSTSVAEPGRSTGTGSAAGEAEYTEVTGSVWPHVEEAIVDRILENRSTIVFANSRRLAERLTGRLNEIYSERQGIDLPEHRPPAQMIAQSGSTAGADPVLAKAHHGSVSKEQRAVVEDELKSGVLRCVVATSSLELGIDMGAVDLVIQVEAPPSAASGLQRVGRAGHQVGEISRASLFPKHRGDVLHTAIVTERMLAGQIEAIQVPRNPLDILAQQTVAASALGPVDVEGWFETVRRSAPFRDLPAPRTRRRSTFSRGASPPTSSPSCARAWSGTAMPVL